MESSRPPAERKKKKKVSKVIIEIRIIIDIIRFDHNPGSTVVIQ